MNGSGIEKVAPICGSPDWRGFGDRSRGSTSALSARGKAGVDECLGAATLHRRCLWSPTLAFFAWSSSRAAALTSCGLLSRNPDSDAMMPGRRPSAMSARFNQRC